MLVPGHCYAVVAYNPSSSMPFEIYNPWGALNANEGGVYGDFIANGDIPGRKLQPMGCRRWSAGMRVGQCKNVRGNLGPCARSNDKIRL